MTLIAQSVCCTMLGIDPKPLRTWLKHAHLSFTAHPSDARLKCLTDTHVQHLATLHARPLAATLPAPVSGVSDVELSQTVLHLQAQVATLQEQLAQFALELLREREFHTAQRLSALEALVMPAGASPPSSPVPAETTAGALLKPTPPRPLLLDRPLCALLPLCSR